MTRLPPDQPARDRIAGDLDANILVEAGAGSGKTSSLVGRMVELVRRGTPLEQVAAITFTRKAAGELRERFELALEKDPDTAPALDDLDRAFLGTIHAFAARLLREHPVEAGLDPAFEEADDLRLDELARTFWDRWLDRLRLDGDPALADLGWLGVSPRDLFETFKRVTGQPDVTFETPDAPVPEHKAVRRELERFLTSFLTVMPKEEPEGGWDKLQVAIRRLRWLNGTTDWSDVARVAHALEGLGAIDLVQKRWSDAKEGKQAIKALHEEFAAWVEGPAAAFLQAWREHRYGPLVRLVLRAREEFAEWRRSAGALSFGDLLTESVRLLRERPEVRRALGERWRHLLVDEFQDTDPLQAELCFLLSSEPKDGEEWRKATPRPGALFLVGDPKQSIYRFRRADIATYAFVRERFAEWGGVVTLTAAFRARQPVADLVNAHFKGPFPDAGTDRQAGFAPLEPMKETGEDDGVLTYRVAPGGTTKEAIFAEDATTLAAWIAAEVDPATRRPAVSPSDFLILTRQRDGVAEHAKALAAWGVPVVTTNARLRQEREMSELLLLLRALADPTNPVLVAAALEGLFFGCTPADLWDARVAGEQFTLTDPPRPSGPLRASAVNAALATMRSWAELASHAPADAVVDRILDDTGLLAWAASETLGEGRAGVLMRLVEELRAGGEALDLRTALDRIAAALEGEGFDVPLRPGRGGAVRVMNLHQAKGLEAHTVVLAGPVKPTEHEVEFHAERRLDGRVAGWLVVRSGDAVVAQPRGWNEFAAAEADFQAAEEDRLLYVATTRAAHRLVVGRCELPRNKDGSRKAAEGSPWAALDPLLAAATELPSRPAAEPPGRPVLEMDDGAMRASIEAADARRVAGARPSWSLATVTSLAKSGTASTAEAQRGAEERGEDDGLDREEVRIYDLPRNRGEGRAWGNVIHRLIEGRLRGREGPAFEAWAAAVVAEEFGPSTPPSRRPAVLSRALATLAELERSPVWEELAAGEVHPELPIAVLRDTPGGPQVVEGVMDAAVRRDGAWTILDWKTDAGSPWWAQRLPQYEAQVGMYVELLGHVTGEPVKGRIVPVGAGVAP